jgi:hypothetical protein
MRNDELHGTVRNIKRLLKHCFQQQCVLRIVEFNTAAAEYQQCSLYILDLYIGVNNTYFDRVATEMQKHVTFITVERPYVAVCSIEAPRS